MVFACDLISTILVHETAIVTILEFRCQCHFWRLTVALTQNQEHLGDVSQVCVTFEFDAKNLLKKNGAGDGDRTRNIQLGKVN